MVGSLLCTNVYKHVVINNKQSTGDNVLLAMCCRKYVQIYCRQLIVANVRKHIVANMLLQVCINMLSPTRWRKHAQTHCQQHIVANARKLPTIQFKHPHIYYGTLSLQAHCKHVYGNCFDVL